MATVGPTGPLRGYRVPGCCAALLAGCLLLASVPCFGGPAPPLLSCDRPTECVASRLPSILADEEVFDYLKSGLTTTLVLSLSAKGVRGERLTSSAQIDVRFEPWEEVFIVKRRRGAGRPDRWRLASEEKLYEWWAGLTLDVAFRGVLTGRVTVGLTLIPFSEEEEADTRRWYADTLRSARLRPGGDTTPELLGEIVDTLTLTSIKRRGVRSYSWSVPIERTP